MTLNQNNAYKFGSVSVLQILKCLKWNIKHIKVKVKVKVKLKQCRYRPGVALRVPGSYGSQIT
jgi:hypothetical protein